MNICFISQEYPPETAWGGIGTYVYNMSHALTQAGHSVTVVALNTTLMRTSYMDQKVRIIRLRRAPDIFLRTTVGTLVYSLQVARTVHHVASHCKSDFVVEAPEWFAEAWWLAHWSRLFPLIIKLHTPHVLISRFNRTRRWRAVEWLERTATLKADAIHAPSRSIASILCRAWNIPKERIEIIRYPVDLSLYNTHRDKLVLGQKPLILYVGKLERRKGVFDIIDALPSVLQRHQQISIAFIGRDRPDFDGESVLRKLQSRLRKFDIRAQVQFVNELGAAELSKWYKRASIVLVPSKWDNYPNVCLEAMACGCAVIASNTGGAAELINDGIDGMLVPPGQPEILSAKISALLASPEHMHDIAECAAEKVHQNFNFRRIVRLKTESYSKLLASYDNTD